MKRVNNPQRRIEEHSQGFGTPTEETVRARAREVAQTNGRRPDEFNEEDLAQARQELEGAQDAFPQTVVAEQDQFVVGDGPVGSAGRAAPTKPAPDEQTVPEELVAEGVDEAAHDEMREGNRESRRRDERYQDQLPSSS